MEKVTHKSSLSTMTDFKLLDGSQVRIEVWFKSEHYISHSGTYYYCNVFTKGKGCRKWIYKFIGHTRDKRILNLITEEQLYTAYYNHWIKLNPIRLFAQGCYNGEYKTFSVVEKEYPSNHYAY